MAATLVSRVTSLFGSNLNISSKDDTFDPTSKDVVEEEEVKADVVSDLDIIKQPDIQYHPNEENWNARTARRLAECPDLLQTPLPEGFPQKLDSPLVWEGKDWTDPQQWEYELSAEQLREIDEAVKHFNGLGQSFGYISPDTFPLPTLGPILHGLSKELHTGRGFFVLRTIPVDNYSREDNILVYAGVSSYVGSRRGVQDRGEGSGLVLGHIKDLTETHSLNTIGVPAYTTDKQVFHTDAGDIISLFVLQTAAEGGLSRISSSWRVYNELAETRPDLIKTLSEPWTLDTFGANPPYVSRPLLFWQHERLIIQYARILFTGFLSFPRSPAIPPITEAQAEALDAVHFIAEKHALGLSFRKGDIQYINNLSIFHGRDGFVDTPEHKRHLLRLWLRNEDLAWKLPEALEPSWKKIYYTATPETERFPSEPQNLNFKGRVSSK